MPTGSVKKSGYKVATKIRSQAQVTLRRVTDDRKNGVKNRYGKLDQRYWRGRLFERTYSNGESSMKDANFYIRIQYQGRRHLFDTGDTDKVAAGKTAAALYRSILAVEWEETIDQHAAKLGKSRKRPKPEPGATLGALLEAFESISSAKPSSRLTYTRALHKIYADINAVAKKVKKKSREEGDPSWTERVDALELSSVTPDKVIDWKQKLLKAAGTGEERKRRTITINSLIRNAKAVFSKRLLPHLRERVVLPDPLPFDKVTLEKSPSTRYHSHLDASQLLTTAQSELRETNRENYLIICLALLCGLRRAEIDNLLWRSVDFEKKVIHVESNEYYQLKTEDSQGSIDLSDSFLLELKEIKKASTSEFVVASDQPAQISSKPGHYRCKTHLAEVIKWLRKHGVKGNRPLHELRKEVGSVIAQEHGIFAASRFLRHGDIQITASTYVDKKQRVVPAIGNCKATSSNVKE